jgi:excisionase family DNA binding protein
MPDEITVIAAARLLGVTLDTVYRSIYGGRLPARKLAGKWQIPVSAIEAKLKVREEIHGPVSR